MSFQLRSGLYWCNSGGRAVFLDAKVDRYFCLPEAANGAFLRLAADASRREDVGRLEALVASGLLVESGASASIRAPAMLDPPTCDVLATPLHRASLFGVVEALACEAAAAWALRSKPFDELIAAPRRSNRRNSGNDQPCRRSIEQVAGSLAAASLLTRSHDRCLVRALAGHSMCAHRRIAAKLVFGVIARPFSAHSWVQLGEAVLVGSYEQARLYTPILVVE